MEKRINPDNLVYKHKTEGISPKDFINYQNLIELFKSLREGNISIKRKEVYKDVLKDQIDFKSDLGEIKKRKSRFKIKGSSKSNTKC